MEFSTLSQEIDADKIEINDSNELRLNELKEMSQQLYPDIDPFFIHMVCVEQIMFENGCEINEDDVRESYKKAQEQMNIKEFHFNVE